MAPLRRRTAAASMVVLLASLVAAAVWLLTRPAPPPEQAEQPYRPLELPADVRARLVVWDYPWPHANPIANPDRFLGERPSLWLQRLEGALAAFRARYPHVEVVIEPRRFAQDLTGDAAGGGALPDVLAVWWDGPQPPADRVVPLNPYLTEAAMAEYHPIAWRLVETEGIYTGWPRWIAFHYWLAPGGLQEGAEPGDGAGDQAGDGAGSAAAAGDWTAVVEGGWDVTRAAEAAAAGLLVPPASPGLLLELAAGTPAGEEGEGEEGSETSAEGQDPADAGRPAARLASVLAALRPALVTGGGAAAGGDPAVGARLTHADFGLAAGFGPVVGHWAVSPPPSGRSRPGEAPPLLLPAPSVWGQPSRVPVMSAGAYVVLRRDGPDEAVRAQLAVELARLLSTWEPEAAVARLLAFPAHREALRRWTAAPPLATAVAQRLLHDAAHAGSFGVRAYGRPEPGGPPVDPLAARRLWQAWLAGELDDEQAAGALLGEGN